MSVKLFWFLPRDFILLFHGYLEKIFTTTTMFTSGKLFYAMNVDVNLGNKKTEEEKKSI